MIRTFVRRFAWTMLGAAIGLSVVLVVLGVLTQFVEPDIGPDRSVVVWAVPALSLVCALALGLVPGARELEVTAARNLLRTDAELIVPDREGWGHRVRTSAWIVCHLTGGLVVGFCLFAFFPMGVVVGIEAALGRSIGSTIPVVEGGWARAGVVLVSAVGAAVAGAAAWPVGAVAERVVGTFLGPTAADRLEVALARQRQEAEHTLLARELHDGIGHALTIVSVQAAAGRRVAAAQPGKAAEALAAIEEVSRGALTELDALLGILRDDRTASPAGGVADVVAQHRRSGLDLRADVDLPSDLPPLLHRTVVRIVAEGLTNARRHGAPGQVRLVVAHTDDELTVRVSNRVGAGTGAGPGRGDRAPAGGGRGLAGIRERAGLFGGTAEAGVVDARWVLTVRLPHLTASHAEAVGSGPQLLPRQGGSGGSGVGEDEDRE